MKSVAARNSPVCAATSGKVSPLTLAWRRMMLGLPNSSKAMTGEEAFNRVEQAHRAQIAGCGECARSETKGGSQWQPAGVTRTPAAAGGFVHDGCGAHGAGADLNDAPESCLL